MDDGMASLARTLMRVIESNDRDAYGLMAEAVGGTGSRSLRVRLAKVRDARADGEVGGPAEALNDLLDEVRRFAPHTYGELEALAQTFREDEAARAASRVHGPAPARTDAAAPRNGVSGGVFQAPVVQAGTFNGGVHTYFGAPQHAGPPPVADWPRLDTADPTAFGVLRTRQVGDEPALPPYVARDGDALLEERMRAAAGTGGLVLVTGEPLAGKSRTAWVGMLANLPGATRVFAPAAGTDLRGLPGVLRARGEEPCVIWLDELEGHLGEHGLSPALLAELVRLRVPVVATMSDEAYDAHRFGGQARARVLAGVDPVELSRAWTADELRRLSGAREDHRLSDASLWCENGDVCAFLAVGPELWDEWWRARRPHAHPHGHLLVRVAMDLARCGTDGAPVPTRVLREACALYGREAAQAAGESFEDALAWASGVRHGVAGMLVPGTEPESWRAFPTLYRDAVTRPDVPPAPLGLWLRAMDVVRGNPDLQELVVESARSELEEEAEGRPEVGLVLGRLYEAAGRAQYAEEWFRHSADAGGVEAARIVGRALAARGEAAEAIPYLERAAEAGDAGARVTLAAVLVDRAVFWLDRGAEGGGRVAAYYARRLRASLDAVPDTVEE
ncbi:sel1 repeat family protein [Streptomyces sp. NBC_01178]|uniref:sel1 repeat family protein n=1 Tax=Streptomyces sp. NBC_01178 TaxID=2903762 RepID=UPI003867B399|nr:sel1 repeat family protein [Streptomyces sp. NBC_01178]